MASSNSCLAVGHGLPIEMGPDCITVAVWSSLGGEITTAVAVWHNTPGITPTWDQEGGSGSTSLLPMHLGKFSSCVSLEALLQMVAIGPTA